MNTIKEHILTLTLTTRCSSRSTCDNFNQQSCEDCLKTVINKRLGDSEEAPHFKLGSITYTTQEVIPLSRAHHILITASPPQVTVTTGRRGRPKQIGGAITVFYSQRRNKAFGPYFRHSTSVITKTQAEELIGEQLLEAKIQRARATLTRKHQDIIIKQSNNPER